MPGTQASVETFFDATKDCQPLPVQSATTLIAYIYESKMRADADDNAEMRTHARFFPNFVHDACVTKYYFFICFDFALGNFNVASC